MKKKKKPRSGKDQSSWLFQQNIKKDERMRRSPALKWVFSPSTVFHQWQ